MKQLLLLVAFTLILLSAHAQLQFHKIWDKRYGGTSNDGLSMSEKSLDGYILVGGSESGIGGDKSEDSRGSGDYWIVKIDSLGNKQWDKRYGGTLTDNLYAVKQCIGGGYIIGGHTYSGISGDKSESSRGGYDYWIVRIDSTGTKQWDRRFGGSANDFFTSLCIANDGGFLLAGYSVSPANGDKTEDCRDVMHLAADYWLVKVDSLGNKQWDKTLGCTGHDIALSVIQTKDHGFLVGGRSSSDTCSDKTQPSYGSDEFWVIKLDSAGNKQWDKHYGCSNGASLHSMLELESGEYILAGGAGITADGDKSEPGCSTLDYWILKVDSLGGKIWDRTFGGNERDVLNNVSLDFDGGFLISGESQSMVSCAKSEDNTATAFYYGWGVKVDSLGSKQWDKTIFTTTGNMGYMIPTDHSCYIFMGSVYDGVGEYKSQPNWDMSNGTSDYWAMKFCMEDWNSISEPTWQNDIQIQTYPNPFTDNLNIALTGKYINAATFTLTDPSGKEVYRNEESNLAYGYTKMLDLSQLPKGTYTVTVEHAGGVVSKTVVKE